MAILRARPLGQAGEDNQIVSYLFDTSGRWVAFAIDRFVYSASGSRCIGLTYAFERVLHGIAVAGDDQGQLKSVVQDLLESVESLAKAVTGRDVDRAANCEALAPRSDLAPGLSGLLQPYLAYTNAYRHAAPLEGQAPLSRDRVNKILIYEDGLLVRSITQAVRPAHRPARPKRSRT